MKSLLDAVPRFHGIAADPRAPAIQRARAALIGALLGPAALAAAALALNPRAETVALALGLVLLGGSGVWLIHRGHAWARWAMTAALGALGALALGGLLADAVFSSWDADAWAGLACGLLLIVGAAALFGSEALDELTGRRTLPRRARDWSDVVQTPSPRSQAPALSTGLSDLDRRRYWGRLTARLAGAATAIAWLAFIAATIALWAIWREAGGTAAAELRNASPLSGLATLFAYLLVGVVVMTYIALAAGVLFFTPFLLVLPIAGPIAARWTHPARILVLRPFNRERVTRGLRRVLERELAPFGHCYTLADSDIRVPLWLRLPIAMGQLSFLAFRQRKIAAPHHLDRLERAMRRTWLRTFNWCVSRDKLFPVSCVDEGWQACVSRMVAGCDAVVMDLSGPSANIMWELDLLGRTGAIERTLFVVDGNHYADAVALLDRAGTPRAQAPLLLGYGDAGLDRPGAVIAGMQRVLSGCSAAPDVGRFKP